MKNIGMILKLFFIKFVQALEICALPYLIGMGMSIAYQWKIPENIYTYLHKFPLLLVVILLYLPVVILYLIFLFIKKSKDKNTSLIFFLEEKIQDNKFTLFLAFLLMIISFGFGIVNYNFATDTSSPNHISKFLAPLGEKNKVTLQAKIIKEPEFRDFNVWLYVKPYKIYIEDTSPENLSRPVEERIIKEYNISDGLVLVKVSKKVENYEKFEYGQSIELKGALLEPEPATNPGAFDYRRYLNNRSIFGIIMIYNEDQIKDLGIRDANFLIKISLKAKAIFLSIMKQTLPYPHSAFQGGIIYGLKVGLPHEAHWEFKWAGMAWILVVAGAHLLMVYIILKMILQSIKPPPYLAFVFLFILLFIFLVITGINPPTVRAYIMLFLYEFTKTFLGQDIKAAVRSAVGIAAFLLLAVQFFPYFSPLMIFDPTVTLSFGAVLSLSYLSGPCERLLRRFSYGLTAIVLLFFVAGLLSILIYYKPVTMSSVVSMLMPLIITTAILVVLTVMFNNIFRRKYNFDKIYLGYNDINKFKGIKKWIHPHYFSYNNVPYYLTSFISAQIAIQFGMVLPLSSMYFQRSPIGGVFANLIGFPALGVIIQIGLCAVLIGLIPFIGLPLAFVLNAADYIGIDFLIKLAHWTSQLFSYPMASKPTLGQITAYYFILFCFVMWDKMFYNWFNRGYMNLFEYCSMKYKLTRSKIFAFLSKLFSNKFYGCVGGLCVILIILGIAYGLSFVEDKKELKIIFMELDGGSGTVIMTPTGKKYLVDAGQIDKRGVFNVGEKTISPIVLSQRIETFDGIILTSLLYENIGGISFMLDNFIVKKFYTSLDKNAFAGNLTTDSFSEYLNDEKIKYNESRIAPLLKQVNAIAEVLKRRNIETVSVKEGFIIESADSFEIKALNPPADKPNSTIGNNCIVLKLNYKNKSVLLAGDIDIEEGEDRLINKYDNELKSNVLLAPAHGRKNSNGEEFIEKVKPEYTIIQYRPPKFFRSFKKAGELTPIEEVMMRYTNIGCKVFRTDKSGAVTVVISREGNITAESMLNLTVEIEKQDDEI